MLDPPEFEVEFDVDGVREHRKVSAINVSNNRFGNESLLYADDVTGGHLGFYVAQPLASSGVARLAYDILRGRLRENTTVTEMTGSAVDLHFPKLDRAVNCVIDGELLPMGRDVSLRLHAGELKVIVPKVARATSLTPQAAA
jgi:diacylglycerol kinase family enzyme